MAEWRRKNPDARWDEPMQVAQLPTSGAQQEPGDVKQKPAEQPLGKGAEEGAPQAGQRIEQETDAGKRAAQGETAAGAGGKPAAPQGPVQEGHTYGAFSDRDQLIWQTSLDKFIAEGRRVFHSAEALGGTIGVSCDMCHPDAANTHPETYPKYQVQFQRVALLRDMINWCFENPMRGRPLPDDDPRLKAVEGYILAQRKSVALEYGKH
jgi:cytochrome c